MEAILARAMPVADRLAERVGADLADVGWSLVHGLRDQPAAEAVLARFGRLMAQDRGEYRYDVKAAPGFADRSSSKSANPLNPHTEASHYPVPPRYVALWCVRPATCGGGHTLLADGYELLDCLSDGERWLLEHRTVAFRDPSRAQVHHGAIVTLGPPLLLRFSYNLLRYGRYDPAEDEMASEPIDLSDVQTFADRFKALFEASQEPVLVPGDSLLIWDNYRMVHSRTGYRDKDRHLVRYWLSHGN